MSKLYSKTVINCWECGYTPHCPDMGGPIRCGHPDAMNLSGGEPFISAHGFPFWCPLPDAKDTADENG